MHVINGEKSFDNDKGLETLNQGNRNNVSSSKSLPAVPVSNGVHLNGNEVNTGSKQSLAVNIRTIPVDIEEKFLNNHEKSVNSDKQHQYNLNGTIVSESFSKAMPNGSE